LRSMVPFAFISTRNFATSGTTFTWMLEAISHLINALAISVKSLYGPEALTDRKKCPKGCHSSAQPNGPPFLSKAQRAVIP
jgi:hypothetical protein